jgi:hypothetical protein
MKQQLHTLKSSTYVRATSVAAAAATLAAVLGGINLNNHNETAVRAA